MDLEDFLHNLETYKREFKLSLGREPHTMEEFEKYLHGRKNRITGSPRLKSVSWLLKNGKPRA